MPLINTCLHCKARVVTFGLKSAVMNIAHGADTHLHADTPCADFTCDGGKCRFSVSPKDNYV